ncbi:hypothetical protein V6582_17510 [Agrobacterium vitis]|uniref:hypothetical protein n=1 Tax=Agrobacterium vitis TaxID=373 RepID=UPI0012E7C672|nr:hypothetical protein [Agrobacterium vitis]MVA27624.1 hypothetical protein [Agrobacterium vitis]
MKTAFIAFAATFVASSAMADDQSVNSAYAMCRAMDNTGLMSSPCQVSGYGQTVTITVDMNASEARNFCAGAGSQMRSVGARFENGWTLHIKSPYSGDNTIAYCGL